MWTIGVMSLPNLQARGFTIQRGHPLDTIERRRDVVEQFTERQWKYFSFGAPKYHRYPDPPAPPSLLPTISDVIVAPFFTSIIVAYIVSVAVEIQSVYAEVLDSNYELIELKQAEDIPFRAVERSAIFEFLNLTPGRSFIVKLYAVDTNDNITSREDYTHIADMTAPAINQFQVYSSTSEHLKVDVNVSDDSGGSFVCIAYLYWIYDLNNELDSYSIELVDGSGSVTFTDQDPTRTYIVELYVRDSSWNSRYYNREGYPNGSGI